MKETGQWATSTGEGSVAKWVRVECGGKQKRGQAILWGDVGDGADVKEAFLEEITHKLRAEAPMGGSQGGYRPEARDKMRAEPAWWIVGFRAAQDGFIVPSPEREAGERGSNM